MSSTAHSATPGDVPASLIQGAGEMADLIRAHAWQATPLGAIATWSESLVAAVNLMLLSPFPFAIYWGPEYIVLYNDVFRPFLSNKHPHSLAQRGSEVWAEAWDVIGEPIRAAFHEGKSSGERGALIPILTDGKMEDRWWSYGFNPIFEGGRIIAVANQGMDETSAVLAERAVRKAQEQFQLGMESAGLGLWHFDPQTGIVTADARMQGIFGSLQPSGAVNYWLDQLHPDDRERVDLHFAGSLAGKHPYELEYRILRDGEVRWVRSKGKVIGPEGHPDRMFAIVEDVTDRKHAEAALQQNEKLAAVGRLAASIAHEINNPLESVTNLLYLIRGSQDLSEIADYIDTAERELRRVSLITNQTLRFHRQSTGPAAEYCSELIADSLSLFQGRLLNNHIEVEKRKLAVHPVDCLGGEIRQVLNNLIGNAIDAMPTSGRLLLRSRDATSPTTGERGVVITIADTGHGMPPAVQQRLFEAFYTTKGIGGTGLGLWISKDIVERHRGRLRFRSCTAEGRSGTVFTLWLPLVRSAA